MKSSSWTAAARTARKRLRGHTKPRRLSGNGQTSRSKKTSRLPRRAAIGFCLWTRTKNSATNFNSLFWHGNSRSEEHTSELQSRLHLVCRLLLEKKKKYTTHL